VEGGEKFSGAAILALPGQVFGVEYRAIDAVARVASQMKRMETVFAMALPEFTEFGDATAFLHP
jgi:hypothetical protein